VPQRQDTSTKAKKEHNMKIEVIILLKGSKRKMITVECNKVSCSTKNSVSCYFYDLEKVEHYEGKIVSVRPV